MIETKLFKVKVLRSVRTRDGLIVEKRETRRIYCETIESAREYFNKPNLKLLSDVEEEK